MFHHRTLLRLISWLCLASLLVLSAPAQAQTPTDKDADDIAIYELPEDHAYVAPPQPIEYYLQDTPASATLSQSTSQLPIFGAEIKPPRFNNIVRSRAKTWEQAGYGSMPLAGAMFSLRPIPHLSSGTGRPHRSSSLSRTLPLLPPPG